MTTSAPPLPADLEDLLRRLRLPHIRRHAPELVATAKAQRWEPAEVLKALFAEEVDRHYDAVVAFEEPELAPTPYFVPPERRRPSG